MTRFFSRLLACVTLLTAALHAETTPARAPEDGAKLATQVRDIFEAKCLDCHGPELPRPKGKFGYVLDLKRVADNPEYVERGNPEKSDLWKMILNDEMPGDDANVPPLTKDEKAAVKRWIEIGAPAAPVKEVAHVATATVEVAHPPEPIWKHALRWLGQFHPLSTHFPVALMFVAVFAEGLAWWTRRETWLHTVRFLVILAALGAVAATVLGWVNAYFSSYSKAPGALLWWHRWIATGSGIWALICAALIVVAECREGSPERQRFRGALLLGVVLIGVSGFLGSALIYGLDHYSWK